MRAPYSLLALALMAGGLTPQHSNLSLIPVAQASDKKEEGVNLKDKKIDEIDQITNKANEIKDKDLLKAYTSQLDIRINERMKWAETQITENIPKIIQQAKITGRAFSGLQSAPAVKVNMGVLQSMDNLVRIGRMQPGGASALHIEKQKTATLKDVFAANVSFAYDAFAPLVELERVKLLITEKLVKDRYTNSAVLQPIAIVELKYAGKVKMLHPFYYLTIEYDLEDRELSLLLRFKDRVEGQLRKLGEKTTEYQPHTVDAASTVNGDPQYYVK